MASDIQAHPLWSKIVGQHLPKNKKSRKVHVPLFKGTGTVDKASLDGFKASFPDLYVYGCTKSTTENDVATKLKETLSLDIVKVEQKSHVDAFRRSFKVQFNTQADYDKAVADPAAWPEGVSVRKWIEWKKPRPTSIIV